MKRYIVVLGMVILLFGCSNNDPMDVSLSMKMEYGGEPLVMFETYQHPDGFDLNFSRVSFFIENLMVGDNLIGTTRQYIDLTPSHSSPELALQGLIIGEVKLTPGTYDVSFSIGIDAADNAKEPTDFPSSNLLSRTSEYWPGWESYIFTRIEGQTDLDEEGVLNDGFSLHMGADIAYRTINLPGTVTVSDSNSESSIILQLDKIFTNTTGEVYDLKANPRIHRPDQQDLVVTLSDNFITAFQ